MRDRRAVRVAATLAAVLAASEAGFRLLEGSLGIDRGRLARFREYVAGSGETAQYEPRSHVLYARPRGLPGVNDLGFTDDDVPIEKRPGVLRVACLGSSTTEGGNPAGREGSYPHFLRQILEQRRGPPIEVMNLGMSGWTTAESLVSYVLTVQDYAPDVVVFHEAVNDVEPRNWPGFRSDYSHYRRPWKDIRFSVAFRMAVRLSDAFAAWQLRDADAFGLQSVVVRPPAGPFTFAGGTLPPDTAVAFRRNVRTLADLVRLRGGRPVLVTMPYDPGAAGRLPVFRSGIEDHNRILRELAAEGGFRLVDLDAAARADAASVRGFFIDLVHMEPEGNRWKAKLIADAVLAPQP